jgi:hypothetical protein
MGVETVWVVNEIREYGGGRFVTLNPDASQPFVQDHYAEIWGKNAPCGTLELRAATGPGSLALHPGHRVRIQITIEPT